jgi:quercetin dioxygenase-like cupin family protein
MEIEYPDEKIIYKKGDGVFIPDGAEHKHKGRAITESVKVIFIEDV